jgi:hypothetical protein
MEEADEELPVAYPSPAESSAEEEGGMYQIKGDEPPPASPEPPPPPARRRPRAAREIEEEDEEDEEEDESPRRRSPDGNWKQLKVGVTCQLVAVCLTLLGFVLYVIGVGIMMAVTRKAVQQGGVAAMTAAGGIAALAGLLGLMVGGAWVLSMVGYVFDLWAPQKHGARVLAICTLGLAVFILFLVSGSFLLGAFASSLAAVAILFAFLLFVAQHFVYLFFLKALALNLRASGLVASIQSLIILFMAVVGGYVLLSVLLTTIVMSTARAGQAPDFGGWEYVSICMGCIVFIAFLVTTVKYAQVLNETRSEIIYRLSGRQ